MICILCSCARCNFASLTISSGCVHPLTSREVVPATTGAATFSALLHLYICGGFFLLFLFLLVTTTTTAPFLDQHTTAVASLTRSFAPAIHIHVQRRLSPLAAAFLTGNDTFFFVCVCVCMCVRLLFIIIMHSPPAWIHYTHATSCPQFNFLCRRGMLYIAHNWKYRPRRCTIMLKKKKSSRCLVGLAYFTTYSHIENEGFLLRGGGEK